MTLCVILIHLGSGRHFLYIRYVLDNATINKTEVLDFAAHIIYTTALVICRLSGLAFYARLVDKHEALTWAVRGAAVFIIAAYLPQLFLIIFHCIPVTGLWPYSFQAEVGNFTCLQWGTVYVTNSAISLICDFILFTIPAAIIYKLRQSASKKVKLSFILMPGLLVIAISCVRMYLVIVGQWEADESWSYDPLLAIEVSEIGSTIIALSVPALKPLFGNAFASLDRTYFSKHTAQGEHKSGDDYGSGRKGSHVVELDQVHRRGRGGLISGLSGLGAEKEAGSPHKDDIDRDKTGRSSYTPESLRPDYRNPSIQSDISRQPMIDSPTPHDVSAIGTVK